ncbi:MAK10-like protein [Tanacetum coccineum]
MRLFQFSLRDQASNWLEHLPAGSITTWEDLTTRFLAQFFPPRRTVKLRNDILMFQQHHGESLSEAWTRFKDLLQKVPHHGIDLWLQNDPRDFTKPVKAIALPQDVSSTSDRRLIELENQSPMLDGSSSCSDTTYSSKQITTSCEICSGPHDTQYCMEDPEQAFVEYASSRTDEAGEEDGDMMFIEIVPKDAFRKEEPEIGEQELEYFDIFPTRSELAYHKYPCIMRRKLNPKENRNGGINNFTGRIKGMHVIFDEKKLGSS